MTETTSEILTARAPLEILGPNGRIGLVALAADLCSEGELRRMLLHGVELYTNRVTLECCRDDADLLLICCTALRAAGVVEQLERELDKPAVTRNQAQIRHAPELIGKPCTVDGFGSPFARRLARAA